MEVRFIYQPYAENSAIFIDNQPISMISALSKFQSQPFSAWFKEILPAIAFEVNDSFSMTYVGRKCEYDFLKQISYQCPECKDIRYEAPVINDTALMRLKKLSRLSSSGITTAKFASELNVYTDGDISQIEEKVKVILPKLSFCRVSVHVFPIESLNDSCESKNSIAVLNMIQSAKDVSGVFGLVSIEDKNIEFQDGIYCIFTPKEALSNAIADLLEIGYYPNLLNQAIRKTIVPQSSPLFPDFFILDKTEPQTVVRIPQSIEYGEKSQLQVSTIPSGADASPIDCRVSNESVIIYENGYIRAVGTGEAIVTVYEQGKTSPLCSAKITAFRRKRIKKLTFMSDVIRMCVGESIKPNYTFEPSDADNISSIRLISKDGTIAAVDKQNALIARSPGTCSILCEAEKIESSLCKVIVYPKLEKIEIEMDKDVIPENSLSKIMIKRIPVEATLDKLSVTIEPPTLATYDLGSNSIFARQTGSGVVSVRSDRSNVSQSYPIKVTYTKSTKAKRLIIGLCIVAVVLLILYFRL